MVQDGLSYVWPQTDIHKTVHKFHISFKGRKSAGMCAQSADFHDPAQIVTNNFTFYRSIAFNLGRFDQSWKWVETLFIPPIESPYTTLYQTVRTCHDISSDEVA